MALEPDGPQRNMRNRAIKPYTSNLIEAGSHAVEQKLEEISVKLFTDDD